MEEPNAGDFLIAMRSYINQVIEDSWYGISKEDKEELVQDTIRNAWMGWKDFKHKDEAINNVTISYVNGKRTMKATPGKAACGWLASIVKALLYDMKRRGLVEKKFEEKLEILYTANSDSPEEIVLAEQVLGDTPVLTKRQQSVRDACITGRGNLEDVAKKYGCSVGTLRNESTEVKEIIKKVLKGELDVSRY